MEKRVLSMLACVAIFTLAMSTTSKANLLVDPGSEGAVISGSGNGVGGWTFFNGGVFSTDFAHSGTNANKLAGGGGYSVPGAYQTFPASAGQQYTMTAFGLEPTVPAVNANTWGALQITFWSGPNGTGSNLGTTDTSPGNAKVGNKVDSSSTAGVWIPLSVTATAPAGTASIQAFDLVLDATAQTTYFDDQTLDLVPEPSTVAMALTGLLGLVAFAKKRRV
ncbi:MAG TPA: PEP-CTERM sorting domain-containing protein [Verrucomicrobiae bacterium]|nr:PEP-CTERM sorting domain-containing protein [Verrucomicrobiae bacterium]